MYIETLLGLKVIINPKGAASLGTEMGWAEDLNTCIALPEGMESSDMVSYVAKRLERVDFLPYLNTGGMEELAGVLGDAWNELRAQLVLDLEPTLCVHEKDGWDKPVTWIYALPIEGQVTKRSPYFKLVLERYHARVYFTDHKPTKADLGITDIPTYGEKEPSWKKVCEDDVEVDKVYIVEEAE